MQGKLEEAERLHRDVLNRQREVLGEMHPNTLASSNNLAECLRAQGKLEEAELLHRDVLNRQRTLGPCIEGSSQPPAFCGWLFHPQSAGSC